MAAINKNWENLMTVALTAKRERLYAVSNMIAEYLVNFNDEHGLEVRLVTQDYCGEVPEQAEFDMIEISFEGMLTTLTIPLALLDMKSQVSILKRAYAFGRVSRKDRYREPANMVPPMENWRPSATWQSVSGLNTLRSGMVIDWNSDCDAEVGRQWKLSFLASRLVEEFRKETVALAAPQRLLAEMEKFIQRLKAPAGAEMSELVDVLYALKFFDEWNDFEEHRSAYDEWLEAGVWTDEAFLDHPGWATFQNT